MNAHNAINRGLRSFLQGFIATLLASPITNPAPTPTLNRLLTAATLAGAYGLLSFAHNLLEDNNLTPKVLKPDPPATPTASASPSP